MVDFVIPEVTIWERASEDGITHLSTGVAVTKDNKILVVRREPGDFLGGNFELPGGGIEEDETIADSVVREVLEETGLHVNKVIGMFPGFEYATPTKPKVRQLNFLVEVSDNVVTLSNEHDQYKWISVDDVESLTTTGPMSNCLKQAFEAIER